MAKVETLTLIKPIVGMSMLKYKELDDLFSEIDIEQDTVVLYFDLYSIICRCYSKDFEQKLDRVSGNFRIIDFVIAILNCIGHYRLYFASRLNKKSKIILTHNVKITDYQKDCYPKFRKGYIEKFNPKNSDYYTINMTALAAYKMIQSICTYIDGIYVIDYDCGMDPVSIMAYIRDLPDFKNYYHVLMTRDLVATQLIGNDTAQLFISRGNQRLITTKTALIDGILYKSIKHSAYPIATIKNSIAGTSLIPYVAMLGGCDHVLKAFKGIKGPIEAASIIADMKVNGYITSDTGPSTFIERYMDYLNETMDDIPKGKNYTDEDLDEMMLRYKAFSIPLNLAASTKSRKLNVTKRLIDMYDQSYLENITDMLSAMNDPDRLINFDHLNAAPVDQEYNGAWW